MKFARLAEGLVLVAVTLSMAGCGQQSSSTVTTTSAPSPPVVSMPDQPEVPPPTATRPTATPAPGSPVSTAPTPAIAQSRTVSLEVVDKEGFEKVLARHKGKVVLVDFWATWCPPCMAQFPHSVELHHKYAEKGLAVISMSVDSRDDKDKVQEFLQEKGANFDNLLASNGIDAVDTFNLDDGGPPDYWLYDRQGSLVERFSPGGPTAKKKFELTDLDSAVEKLLKTGDSK